MEAATYSSLNEMIFSLLQNHSYAYSNLAAYFSFMNVLYIK